MDFSAEKKLSLISIIGNNCVSKKFTTECDESSTSTSSAVMSAVFFIRVLLPVGRCNQERSVVFIFLSSNFICQTCQHLQISYLFVKQTYKNFIPAFGVIINAGDS